MRHRPDPIADILIRSDLAGIIDHALEQRKICLREGFAGETCAEAWRHLAHAARDLMPLPPTRHQPVQLELFKGHP